MENAPTIRLFGITWKNVNKVKMNQPNPKEVKRHHDKLEKIHEIVNETEMESNMRDKIEMHSRYRTVWVQ